MTSAPRAADAALNGQRVVLLIGDSHLAKLNKPRLDVLESALDHAIVLNAAVGGSNSADLVRTAAVLARTNADAVVVAVGTNDLAPWKRVSVEDYERNLGWIVAAFTSRPVVLMSPPPVLTDRQPGPHARTPSEVARYSAVVDNVCATTGAIMLDSRQALGFSAGSVSTVLAEDGVHLSDTGYDRLIPALAAVLTGVLSRSKATADTWRAASGSGPMAGLDDPIPAVMALAWESFQAGCPPIGAVVTDESGNVTAAGRNMRYEAAGPLGAIVGTSIAHAEINALSRLSPGRYPGHTLWASLQPCPMCSAAAMTSGIGRVAFLGADRMWSGAERLPELSPAVADRWPVFCGPQDGWVADWQTLVSALFQLSRHPSGPAVEERRRQRPGVVALAEAIHADSCWRARITSGTLDSALAELVPLLPSPD